jgi:hypothetical protein
MPRKRERGRALRLILRYAQDFGSGQALAEFALMIPVLILLLFGMTFAAFYAFRSAAVDWGVFVTGVARGSYNTPATGQARESVLGAHWRIPKWSAPGAFAGVGGRFP